MKKGLNKILSLCIFIVLSGSIFYFGFYMVEKEDNSRYSKISVSSTSIIPKDEYIKFTKIEFDRLSQYPKKIIKDRFEKHPYISDVKLSANNNLLAVQLIEKRLKAKVLYNGEIFLLTDKFQVLPVFNISTNADLPLITNLSEGTVIKPLMFLKTEDIIRAYKILDAAGYVNKELYKNISEINLNNGKNIIISLSSHNFEIRFGKGDEVKKILALNSLLNDKNEKDIIAQGEYVDLRFSDAIYSNNMAIIDTGLTE